VTHDSDWVGSLRPVPRAVVRVKNATPAWLLGLLFATAVGSLVWKAPPWMLGLVMFLWLGLVTIYTVGIVVEHRRALAERRRELERHRREFVDDAGRWRANVEECEVCGRSLVVPVDGEPPFYCHRHRS
jgi:hypothetical protein